MSGVSVVHPSTWDRETLHRLWVDLPMVDDHGDVDHRALAEFAREAAAHIAGRAAVYADGLGELVHLVEQARWACLQQLSNIGLLCEQQMAHYWGGRDTTIALLRIAVDAALRALMTEVGRLLEAVRTLVVQP